MTRPRHSPAVQLARDVLHVERCNLAPCDRCDRYYNDKEYDGPIPGRLARALLWAVRT